MLFTSITIITAGIGGTAVMTFLVNSLGFIIAKKFKLTRLLGTMLTGETTADRGISRSNASHITGILLHYVIGIVFSWLYFIFFSQVDNYRLWSTLLFGTLAGTVAVFGWGLYYYIHKNPPRINLREFCILIFFGHVIFGVTLLAVYRFFFHEL